MKMDEKQTIQASCWIQTNDGQTYMVNPTEVEVTIKPSLLDRIMDKLGYMKKPKYPKNQTWSWTSDIIEVRDNAND